jgi:hypothetical protein
VRVDWDNVDSMFKVPAVPLAATNTTGSLSFAKS